MLTKPTRILIATTILVAYPLCALAQPARSAGADSAMNTPMAASPMNGSPTAATTPSTSPPPTAATGAAANTNATAPDLAAGLPVKDNTGAQIGQIASLQTDASGKRMATIKMGSDSFSVDAANLAVENGAAVVNLSQAQITQMLHPAKH